MTDTSMTAVRLHAPGSLQVDTVPMPRPGPGEVQIQVVHTGICGTDLHLYDGWQMGSMVTFPPMPAIIGHEVSGIVSELGPGVSRLKLGNRITVQPQVYCGDCIHCQRNNPNLCTNKIKFKQGGSWADWLVVNERAVYLIPEHLSFELAAMSEPLGCALRAVERSELCPGDNVFVAGGGTIGLMLIALARRLGANLILASEPHASRRSLALAVGADVVIDPAAENPAEVVLQATNGVGADISLEAAGMAASTSDCLASARAGGRVMLVGLSEPSQLLSLNQLDIVFRELDILGSILQANNMESVLRLLPGLGLEAIITHHLPLSAAESGIQLCKSGEATKILFDVSQP